MGAYWQALENTDMKAFLHMPKALTGVYVTKLEPLSHAAKVLPACPPAVVPPLLVLSFTSWLLVGINRFRIVRSQVLSDDRREVTFCVGHTGRTGKMRPGGDFSGVGQFADDAKLINRLN
jgi:hypothetical protein